MNKSFYYITKSMTDGRLEVKVFLARKNIDTAEGRLLESFRKAGLMLRMDTPQKLGWIYTLTTRGEEFIDSHIRIHTLWQMKQLVEQDPQGLAALQELLAEVEMKDEDQEEAKVWN